MPPSSIPDIKELKVLYQYDLSAKLKIIEKERLIIKKKLVLLLIILFIIATIACYELIDSYGVALNNSKDFLAAFIMLLFIFVVYGVTYWIFGNLIKEKYRLNFKREIIKTLFSYLLKDVEVIPDGKLSIEDIRNSKLFPQGCGSGHCGEDYITGKLDGHIVEFNEVYIQKNSNNDSPKVLEGLFFVVNTQFTSAPPIIMKNDIQESVLGRLVSRPIQRFLHKGYQLVFLEDVEFEKNFRVYTSDQIQARVFLTPKVMSLIQEFRSKFKKAFDLSIVEGNIYIAVPNKNQLFEDHFEPKYLFKNELPWKEVEHYHSLFKFLEQIIKEFKDFSD